MNSTAKLGANFWIYRGGQMASVFGSASGNIALAWWVLKETDSPLIMSSIIAPAMISRNLFLILFGPIADHFPLIKVAVFADIARAIIWTLTASFALTQPFNYWVLLSLVLLGSIFDALFSSTTMPIIPRLVKKSLLKEAFSKSHMANSVGAVLGGAVGGLVVGYFDTGVTFLINATSFLVSGFLLAQIKLSMKNEMNSKSSESKKSFFAFWYKNFKFGIRYVLEHKDLQKIVLVFSLLSLFVTHRGVSYPFFAKVLTNSEPWVLGALQSAFASGTIIAGLYYSKILKFLGNVGSVLTGLFVLGVATIVFGQVFDAKIMAAIAVCSGFSLSIVQITVQTQLMIAVPEKVRGRVFAQFGALEGFVDPLAVTLAGAFIAQIGFTHYMIAAGVGIILVSIPTFMRGGVRNILEAET